MDRVAIDGIDIALKQNILVEIFRIFISESKVYLFVIVKDAVTPKWTSADDVTVGENVSLLRINDEAGRLAGDS